MIKRTLHFSNLTYLSLQKNQFLFPFPYVIVAVEKMPTFISKELKEYSTSKNTYWYYNRNGSAVWDDGTYPRKGRKTVAQHTATVGIVLKTAIKAALGFLIV